MENILINISANTIEIRKSSNNRLIHKIVNITSVFNEEDLRILLKYEEATLTLTYSSIIGVSVDGVTYTNPISFLDFLTQLETIVVVKPSVSGGSSGGGGDASASNQIIGNSTLNIINNKLSLQATAEKQDDAKMLLQNLEVLETQINTKLTSINSKDFAKEATLNVIPTKIDVTNSNLSLLNKESTQANIKNNTDNLDVLLSSRLKPSDTLSKVSIVDTITNVITIKADLLNNQGDPLKVDASDTTQPISVNSLPLPTNASTSALQTAGNNTLVNINDKIPSLGQATVLNSTPVVLPISQIATLTPLPQIIGFNLETTQSLIKDKTDNIDVPLSTRLKASDTLNKVETIGSVTAITNALPIGDNNIGNVDIVTLPALVAGNAIIGKIGIDQSDPGISNKVDIGKNGEVATNGTIFKFSTVNSTTTQLISGQTYTGTIENIVNQQSYSLLFFSDQNAIITVKQFIDASGIKLISNNVFNYTAGFNNFSISKTANGNFIQVIVQNTGVATTTALQLDLAFGTIPASTFLNNSPSSINEINGSVVSVNQGSSDQGTLRITQATESASGIITAINLVPNGLATLNSAVEITPNGATSLSIQVTGTYTGALSVQLTNNGVRWETVTSSGLFNSISGIYSSTIPSNTTGIYQFKCGGFLKARIVALVAVTGTASIIIKTSNTSSLTTIDNALPPGTNNIGTINIASGQTLGTLATIQNGQSAHSSVVVGNPFRISGKVKTTNDLTLVSNDVSDLVTTSDGALINKPYSVPELDWTFACVAPVNNTTNLVLKASAGVGLKNYLTSFQITNSSATIATEIQIKDGAIVIWRGFVGVGTVLNSAVGVSLSTPLKTSVDTALSIACATTGSSIYVNAQGYVAP